MSTKTKTIDHFAQWKARGVALGLSYESDERCPRTLLGREHLELECWCISGAKDHAATWVHTRDGRVVLWGPYDVDPTDLFRLSTAAEREGLRLTVDGFSPWNPGSTVALTFSPMGGAR